MNPRNRDARRLRAVRRPHSLILTLSIRPSSKSNDDTSSFRCGSRLLFFSPKSREKCRYPAPETPPHPDTKVRNILPHLSTSTACLTLPAVDDGQVEGPAQLAWLCMVQAHKQQLSCLSVCLVLSTGDLGSGWILQLWGLDKGSAWGLFWRALLFRPNLPVLHVLQDHGENTDPDRVVASESLEMNSSLPYFYGRGHNIWMESVCAWCSAGGAYRIGQDRAKAWFTLLAVLYCFLIV